MPLAAPPPAPAAPVAAGPATAAAPLLATLDGEVAALDRLGEGLAAAMAGFRAHDHATLTAEGEAASAHLAALDRLRALRVRQGRLLGRVLGVPAPEGDAPDAVGPLAAALARHDPAAAAALAAKADAVRARAADVRDRSTELGLALDVAARLVRDLLDTCRAPGPAARVYTAGGAARVAPPRALVDRVG